MSFEKNGGYKTRIDFKNGVNAKVFKFPKGNYYAGMSFDINLDITITVGAMATILQHQVSRMIESMTIVRDDDKTVWSLAGEDLARLFRYREGVEAPDNAQMAVGVGANTLGRMFLDIPFRALDAQKASDFAMDTNSHDYELKIKYRNITIDGGVYADVSGGTLAVNDAGSYIDLTLEKVTPIEGINGPDSYQLSPPHFIGYMNKTHTIAATEAEFDIELPEHKVLRTVFLFANHDTTANNPVGSDAIFTDSLRLQNTQDRTVQNIKATTLRQKTGLKHRNNSLEAGYYEYTFTQYGHMRDSLISDGIAPLKIVGAVSKQANDTRITSVTQAVLQQGGVT